MLVGREADRVCLSSERKELIDPMHSYLLGTVTHVHNTWVKEGII
jgi:hypothetical protein